MPTPLIIILAIFALLLFVLSLRISLVLSYRDTVTLPNGTEAVRVLLEVARRGEEDRLLSRE